MTQDELAVAPWGDLSAFGVDEDHADMLRPSGAAAKEAAEMIASVRADTILREVGVLSPTEFAAVMHKMLEALE